MRSRRKALGQHFLLKPEILDRMVEYAELSSSDIVLEIGAGKGDLTRRLAERAGLVIAVELDDRFLSYLEPLLKEYPNIKLLIGDVLKLKPTGFNKVVSNPPYSISSRLLEWLIYSRPELMILTLQREFAVKLIAKPGSPKYLYISVISSLLYDSRILEIIPRRFFDPPPRVDSALVSMRRRSGDLILEDSWREILKKLFTRRRQRLRRVISDLLEDVGSDRLGQVFSLLDEHILSRRVYELTPSEILEVAKILERAIGGIS